MPDVQFAWEPFHACIREARPLIERHWEELAYDTVRVPIDPDWDAYMRMELAGALQALVARVDGVMVGYAFLIVHPMLHSRGTLVAATDVFWLAPAYREGWAGVRLMKEILRGMKAAGVKVVDITPTTYFQDGRVVKLLERLGGRAIETRVRFWVGEGT